MRVVYLNPVGALGGAEFSLLDLLSALGEARPELERHLITGTEGALIDRARELGVKVHPLIMPASLGALGDSGIDREGKLWSMLQLGARCAALAPEVYVYARRLSQLLDQLAPDVIHSNGIKTHCLIALANSREVPVIWHVRDFVGSRALMSRALRWASRRMDLACAVSKAVRKDLLATCGAVPVETIYDAVDVERFSPGGADGQQLDEKAGLPHSNAGVLRVGLVATYARWKGQLLFLDAAAKLTARCPDLRIRYFIVGGPIYATSGSQFGVEELRARIHLLGLHGRAALIPFEAEPTAIYRGLDVVVHASTKPEPFGRTIVEGMACGRAVIVSRDGGALELFTENEDAVSFQPGSAESLAAVTERLAMDPILRSRLGQAGRRTAVDRFSRPRLAGEVLSVYDRVCRT